MAEEEPISVNFGRPVPLFPLDAVTLLPQQVHQFHIFEPRYRQMVQHALDGPGQIAMGVFDGDAWRQEYHGRPPVRPAVCLGQIVQHEKLPDGRYNILLQGVCRARIREELPAEQGRLYRLVLLEPVGLESGDEDEMHLLREELTLRLSTEPLSKLTHAERLVEILGNESIPTHALLEVVNYALVTEPTARYRLLAEPNPTTRMRILRDALNDYERLVRFAQRQHPEDWPKGVSWN